MAEIIELDVEGQNKESEVLVGQSTTEDVTNLSVNDSKGEPIENVEVLNFVEDIEEDDPFEILVAEGLSQLGKSADGTMQVFLSLSLKDKELELIDGLSSYNHLQILDISHNEIQDLSPLSNLPYLISIDASHNNLTDILNFKPPLSLREVDLSHNKIETMSDLSSHKSLKKLILDYNFIKEICGITGCRRLKTFSIRNNLIEKLSGLECLPLTYLNLSQNRLRRIENISTLRDLQTLDLSYNFIRSLRGMQCHDYLHELKFAKNEMIDLAEIRYIRDLPLLRTLDFSLNPIQNLPDYRLSILIRIPCLVELDNSDVLPKEKIASQNLFQPSREIIAARNHMINVLRSYQQPIKLLSSTLSSVDTPYPMLILTGPSGACKRLLTKRLCQDFPTFFGQGVSYTTRGLRENEKVPRESEVDGIDYHFVTKEHFERDALAGKFIETSQLYNCHYGVSRDTIEAIATEGLACVLHLELEGVMIFKNTHFEPRYVLILPETSKAHEARMRSRGFYSENQINQALDRVHLYEEMNREHPGYFDMTICCDDLDEAYSALKKVVMEYLGMSPVHSTASKLSQSTTHESALSATTITDATRSIATPFDHLSAGSPVKPWRRSVHGSHRNDSSQNITSTRSNRSPVEIASIRRRFKKMQSATIGVTSTSKEQLLKLKLPLSATAVPLSCGYDDFGALDESKRSASVPNGQIMPFPVDIVNMTDIKSEEDDSSAEEGSEESDMSSAHANYMEAEEELGTHSADRASMASVLS